MCHRAVSGGKLTRKGKPTRMFSFTNSEATVKGAWGQMAQWKTSVAGIWMIFSRQFRLPSAGILEAGGPRNDLDALMRFLRKCSFRVLPISVLSSPPFRIAAVESSREDLTFAIPVNGFYDPYARIAALESFVVHWLCPFLLLLSDSTSLRSAAISVCRPSMMRQPQGPEPVINLHPLKHRHKVLAQHAVNP